MLILKIFIIRSLLKLKHLVNYAYGPTEGVLVRKFVDAKAGEVYIA
jgi:hypothetical protein